MKMQLKSKKAIARVLLVLAFMGVLGLLFCMTLANLTSRNIMISVKSINSLDTKIGQQKWPKRG